MFSPRFAATARKCHYVRVKHCQIPITTYLNCLKCNNCRSFFVNGLNYDVQLQCSSCSEIHKLDGGRGKSGVSRNLNYSDLILFVTNNCQL